MVSIADALLAAGAAINLEVVHGETIRILSGPDAGKSFTGIVEIDQDSILEAAMLGEDRRSRRIVRFREGNVPDLHNQNVLETSDGKKWKAVRMPGNSHLSVDFELVELNTEKDS